jgi:aspartate aminotransferase-like enzyme
MGSIPADSKVMTARLQDGQFEPPPLDEVTAAIRAEKPDLVFAPHVETSSGMILPDDYLRSVADAVHEVGGMFVLDCIASGAIWVDMETCGVDVLISAPQKGWSGTPCCGLVMLSGLARERIESTTSTSFACDLRKWLQIMAAYEGGGHAYHATMPTDGLKTMRDVMAEIEAFGFAEAQARQQELGDRVRRLLEDRGVRSVAAPGFQAPGVVVSYTDDGDVKSGRKFLDAGVQIAAGVPLKCGEPDDFSTFRIGLFGLDKLRDVDRTVAGLERAVANVLG